LDSIYVLVLGECTINTNFLSESLLLWILFIEPTLKLDENYYVYE